MCMCLQEREKNKFSIEISLFDYYKLFMQATISRNAFNNNCALHIYYVNV